MSSVIVYKSRSYDALSELNRTLCEDRRSIESELETMRERDARAVAALSELYKVSSEDAESGRSLDMAETSSSVLADALGGGWRRRRDRVIAEAVNSFLTAVKNFLRQSDDATGGAFA